MGNWFTPKSITRAGATLEQIVEGFKAGLRAGFAEFLKQTDTPSGQLVASADEPQDETEQVA